MSALVLVSVSHSWLWQSVADLCAVHPVEALILKFHHSKLIYITIPRYWKLTGLTTKGRENSTYKHHHCLRVDLTTVLVKSVIVGLHHDRGLELLVLIWVLGSRSVVLVLMMISSSWSWPWSWVQVLCMILVLMTDWWSQVLGLALDLGLKFCGLGHDHGLEFFLWSLSWRWSQVLDLDLGLTFCGLGHGHSLEFFLWSWSSWWSQVLDLDLGLKFLVLISILGSSSLVFRFCSCYITVYWRILLTNTTAACASI